MSATPPTVNEFHISSDDELVIVCPACGYTKVVKTDEIPIAHKRFTAKCKCTHRFVCSINSRRSYRKKVHFNGQCHKPGSTEAFDICVHDLSMGGLRFSCDVENLPAVDEILVINFRLDDCHQTPLSKRIRVVCVRKDGVGAEFIDKSLNPALGFYFLS